MSKHSSDAVAPRNGHTLVACIVARISGCQKQKEVSNEDQVDHGKEVVKEYWDGPVKYRVIATQGKGERLDRPELKQVEKLIRTRQVDLPIFEDVGRLVRGPAAHRRLQAHCYANSHLMMPAVRRPDCSNLLTRLPAKLIATV